MSLRLALVLALVLPGLARAEDGPGEPGEAVAAIDAGAEAGAGSVEALRQLELAREDLRSGHAERALKAARSAHRLDPSCHEALFVQAEVFEATGDWSKARAMVLAYLGVSGADDPRAEALLERAAAAEPVRVEVLDDGTVRFMALEHVEDPVVHWRRASGAWQSEWMERTDGGAWELRVDPGGSAKLAWWVEPMVGDALTDTGERPFVLGLP